MHVTRGQGSMCMSCGLHGYRGRGGRSHIAHLLYNIWANERGNPLYSMRVRVAEGHGRIQPYNRSAFCLISQWR